MLPTKNRYPSSYLLEVDDQKILFDCGHTAIARLIELGIDPHDIDPICITHFHTDHFSGCFPLIHARWVDDSMNKKDHQPVTVVGPTGLQERFAKWRTIFWPEAEENYPIDFIEGPNVLFELVERSRQDKLLNSPSARSKNIIRSFPVHHVSWFQSIGYRFDDQLAYTGDCGSNQPPEFYEGIRDVQTLLIEAGALTPAANHLTANQAVRLAQKYHIKRVILTHVREQNLPLVQKIADQYPDFLVVAEDLKIYEI